ncbi:hypothetical protein [Nocardia caishijiensis]|uniref:Ribosomal protein S12 methylthiotransferase accessory factor n=1 Tax=Nocardia caishijiensis TaxID=184756 RepID=A0ABQ6YPN5_9NOCA|nr:hypothetical protein [Nocardia caishijiensis]KAF0847768.1 hypothetical protein FNL39_103670 [Nocardia caishijiensis]
MGFGRGLFRRRESASRDEIFGKWAVDILRAFPEVVSAEFDAAEFHVDVVYADGTPQQCGLRTPFRLAEGLDGEEAVQLLAEYLRGALAASTAMAEPVADWATMAPTLRPVLRPAGDLTLEVQGQRIGENIVWRPLLPCLTERVVIDLPTSMRTVSPEDLVEWGVDAHTVFATARTNMTDFAVETVSGFDPDEGVHFLSDDDGDLYAGSLPLVEGWLAGLGNKAGAQPLCFVPGSFGVLAGVASSPERVCELVAVAREMFDNAVRPVSPVPYTVDGQGRLVPFTVPLGHPAWAAIRSAEAALAAPVYAAQYPSLQADVDSGRRTEYVAELLHVRAPNGIEDTVAAWTDTVPTLLPRAHVVSMVDLATASLFPVPWEVLDREVGLRSVPGLFPPRFLVEHHPDQATLARLRAAGRWGTG